MTTLQASQLKALVLANVNAGEHEALLIELLDGYWGLHEAYAVYPGIQYLKTLCSALMFVIGRERVLVDTDRDGDRSLKLHQRVLTLEKMYEQAQAELAQLLAYAALTESTSFGAIGTITRTTPIAWPYATAESGAELDRLLRGDAFLVGSGQ